MEHVLTMRFVLGIWMLAIAMCVVAQIPSAMAAGADAHPLSLRTKLSHKPVLARVEVVGDVRHYDLPVHAWLSDAAGRDFS